MEEARISERSSGAASRSGGVPSRGQQMMTNYSWLIIALPRCGACANPAGTLKQINSIRPTQPQPPSHRVEPPPECAADPVAVGALDVELIQSHGDAHAPARRAAGDGRAVGGGEGEEVELGVAAGRAVAPRCRLAAASAHYLAALPATACARCCCLSHQLLRAHSRSSAVGAWPRERGLTTCPKARSPRRSRRPARGHPRP